MKLNIQLFGGRGASSSSSSSFDKLISKRENLKYSVTFGTGIDIGERNGKLSSITSYKIGQLESAMKNIDETVIQVQQGSYDKRINQLKDIGFKVISKTTPDNNDKTTIVLAHIRRK